MRLRCKYLGLILTMVLSMPSLAGVVGIGFVPGMSVAPIPSKGGEVFYNADQFTVGVNFHKGELNSRDLVSTDDVGTAGIKRFVVDTTMMAIEGRLFLGLGMNVFGSIGQRKIDLEYAISDTIAGTPVSAEGSLVWTSPITTVGIGFLGRWETYYIGLDLLGYSQPNSTKLDSSMSIDVSSYADLAELNDDLNEAAEKVGEMGSLQLLMFHIGIII
jgi:hypothetical protein